VSPTTTPLSLSLSLSLSVPLTSCFYYEITLLSVCQRPPSICFVFCAVRVVWGKQTMSCSQRVVFCGLVSHSAHVQDCVTPGAAFRGPTLLSRNARFWQLGLSLSCNKCQMSEPRSGRSLRNRIYKCGNSGDVGYCVRTVCQDIQQAEEKE
jgi:hypothetical protein